MTLLRLRVITLVTSYNFLKLKVGLKYEYNSVNPPICSPLINICGTDVNLLFFNTIRQLSPSHSIPPDFLLSSLNSFSIETSFLLFFSL